MGHVRKWDTCPFTDTLPLVDGLLYATNSTSAMALGFFDCLIDYNLQATSQHFQSVYHTRRRILTCTESWLQIALVFRIYWFCRINRFDCNNQEWMNALQKRIDECMNVWVDVLQRTEQRNDLIPHWWMDGWMDEGHDCAFNNIFWSIGCTSLHRACSIFVLRLSSLIENSPHKES